MRTGITAIRNYKEKLITSNGGRIKRPRLKKRKSGRSSQVMRRKKARPKDLTFD
jgi:hypothetical protein